MKRIAIIISSVLFIVSFSLAQNPQTQSPQTPQKKEDKSTKKEEKKEMTTTKVIHHCNPNGTTCVCGNNCKEGCCVTVADTKKPEGKESKSTAPKTEKTKPAPKKDQEPPK